MNTKRTSKTLPSLIALLFACLWTSSAAANPALERARIERALSARHHPPTARQLLLLDPDVERVLREIVEEPRGNRLARNRALSALGHFPGMENEALLARVVDETASSKRGIAVLDLSQALRSYAAIVGPKAIGRLRPQLAHPVPEVRLAAAVGLRLSRHRDARVMIASHLESERSMMARAEMQRQLTILDKRGAPR